MWWEDPVFPQRLPGHLCEAYPVLTRFPRPTKRKATFKINLKELAENKRARETERKEKPKEKRQTERNRTRKEQNPKEKENPKEKRQTERNRNRKKKRSWKKKAGRKTKKGAGKADVLAKYPQALVGGGGGDSGGGGGDGGDGGDGEGSGDGGGGGDENKVFIKVPSPVTRCEAPCPRSRHDADLAHSGTDLTPEYAVVVVWHSCLISNQFGAVPDRSPATAAATSSSCPPTADAASSVRTLDRMAAVAAGPISLCAATAAASFRAGLGTVPDRFCAVVAAAVAWFA